MTALAFMQNMWVRDPKRMKQMIAQEQQRNGSGDVFRLRMIEYTLFSGCVSGRRLKAAFGELIDEIIWEESTREIAGDAKTTFPPDLAHMRSAIESHRPQVVLTFGKIAARAAFEVLQQTFDGPAKLDISLITAPHPAARQPEVPQLLRDAADKLRSLCHQLKPAKL